MQFRILEFDAKFALFLNEICTKLFAKTTLIDVDISPKGDLVAMIEVDTTTATLSSAISFMSNKGEIVYSSIEDDTLLAGIRYLDNTNVIAVGDNKLIKIDKNYNNLPTTISYRKRQLLTESVFFYSL